MSGKYRPSDQLVTLVELACTSDLSDERHRDLEQLLSEDVQNCDYYLQRCRLHVEYAFYVRADAVVSEAMRTVRRSFMVGGQAVASESVQQLPEIITTKDSQLTPPPVRHRKLRDRFADQIEPGKHLIHFAAVVAFITLGSWVYFIEFVGRPAFHHDDVAKVDPERPKEPEPEPAARIIARLVDTSSGAAWGESKRWRAGDGLELGDTLELKQGLAEIRYDSGVRVILQGPAVFEIGGVRGGRLQRGKLVARVLEKGKGFIVETPTTRVVDVGTEFGVGVDALGNTATQVLDGKVRVYLIADKKSPGFELVAGEAVAVGAAGKSIRSVAPASASTFARSAASDRPYLIRPTWDTYVYRTAPDENLSDEDVLIVKHDAKHAKFEREAWLKFDLTGIDLDRLVDAKLALTIARGSGKRAVSGDWKFEVFGMWEDNIGTKDPAKVTWNTTRGNQGKSIATFRFACKTPIGQEVEASGTELVEFLRESKDRSVVLVVKRITSAGRTHYANGFASMKGGSVGPALLLRYDTELAAKSE